MTRVPGSADNLIDILRLAAAGNYGDIYLILFPDVWGQSKNSSNFLL